MQRIFLIISIIAGIGACVLGFVQVKEKVEALQQERTSERDQKVTQTGRADKAEKTLKKTSEDLKQTSEELDQTKTSLASANTARQAAEGRAQGLTVELDKAKGERTKALQDLNVWVALGLSPDQIKTMKEDVTTLKAEGMEQKIVINKQTTEITRLTNFVAALLSPEKTDGPPLPAGLKGKVLKVDPRWDFVLLDIGQKDNAIPGGVMMVHREGKLIAKVRLKTVQQDQTIASVISGWKITELQEGDLVLY